MRFEVPDVPTAPPYPCPVPDKWTDAPFEELPRGWQRRVLAFIAAQEQPPD